jgi:amino acid adenylation domain-containing protein
MAFSFVIPGVLDYERFTLAWQQVAGQSDALRTRVRVLSDGTFDRYLAEEAPTLTVIDLAEGGAVRAQFERWCRERCNQPLDFSGALVESALVPLAGGRTGWYLNQHHLVTDAWSTTLLVNQVNAGYQALSDGRPAPAPLEQHYYRTAAAIATDPDRERAACAHWSERASRPTHTVPLYGQRGTPADLPGSRITIELDAERSRALDRLSRKEGFATLSPDLARFNMFATLLAALLYRVSETRDIGFDAPVAGRPTAAAKRVLGCFMELFPFAVTVRPDESFRSLAAQSLEESIRFLSHARPGLSAPSADTASNVALNYLPIQFEPIAGHPLDVDWIHPGHGDPTHALWLQVHDLSGSGRITLHFDCNDSVLTEQLRQRLPAHFLTLLDAMLSDPDARVANVALLLDDEGAILDRLNDTGKLPLPESTVIDRFREVVALYPERTALRQGDDELSFSELADRVAQQAAMLAAQNIRPGDRVVITGRRSLHSVIAVLAVLWSRAAYVPVDGAAPPTRLADIVADSGAKLVLTTADLPGSHDLSAPVLKAGEARPAEAASLALGPGPLLDDLAYLIFTSGSTGRPKGVLIDHLGLADYLDWASRQYVRGECLCFPLFTSLAVDLTVTSLFLPLVTGGTLDIYPESDGPVDRALMDVVRSNTADFIKLTPSHLSLLVRTGLEGSSIRRMVLGGENLTTQSATAVSRQISGELELTNEYGPTEAVVGCVAHRFDPATDHDRDVPIGRPVDHVQLAILNEAGEAVPVCVPGELWVSRPGLALGYHGMEQLTAERFKDDPASIGGRRYRTGDRVRLREDGVLEYLGRLDRQVKISGFRVEPGEIEQAIQSLPGIRDCAVVAHRPAEEAPATLEAYYLADQAWPEQDLRDALTELLPGPLIPARFFPVSSIPLAASGKLDERALIAGNHELGAEKAYRAPEGPVEELLAGLWAAELSIERVSADDSFFKLGGSSLNAMQVMLRLCREYDIDLPIETLFSHPVLTALARVVEDKILADDDETQV